MRQRVVVCGATGFIGRNVLKTFAPRPDMQVIGVWHERPPEPADRVTWVWADLRVPGDVGRVLEGADLVVQAAASTSGAADTVRTPHLHVTDNAVMNSLLLREAHERSVRHLVFFSCSIMYPSSTRPLKESDFRPGDPLLDAYFGAAWTKVYIERMCEFYARLGRTRFTVLRHANIFGPYDKCDPRRSHVFAATVTKVLEGDGAITVWGDGREARDFLYVDDLIDMVRLAVEHQQSPFELVNVGSGTLVTVSELVALVRHAANVSREVRYEPSAPTLKTSVCLDTAKAKRLFGWEPSTSLEDGLRRTLAWRRALLAAQVPGGRHASA